MSARDAEERLMVRCIAVVQAGRDVALNEREANVFRVASMILRSRFPVAAAALKAASDGYFAEHPTDLRHAEEVVREGWITSFPRLRDTLTARLEYAMR